MVFVVFGEVIEEVSEVVWGVEDFAEDESEFVEVAFELSVVFYRGAYYVPFV